MVTASTVSTPAPVRARQVPALYECVVSHARTAPLRHAFQHRTYMWLIDIDDVPVLPRALRPLARFEARDHFGGADRSLRAGLEGFLAARGVRLDGGRVLMLAHARVLGYVFNPLTLYWCHGPHGDLVAVVAEVHNTYGERHCYLLRPDARGLAVVPKEFYVSPFFPVDGTYRMRVPEPSERLDVSVQLRRGAERPFTATLRGARRPATTGGVLAAALRHPWSTAAVSAGIRRHGLWLFLRRLPVRPRPSHCLQEGMK
ncbi:hypothetical protein DWB77_07359 [Streptomyces hundungensis]|uniref:DUF1365 domain-containing protein n=1 Tax=Streptomyces hundungensis TaxID=1077946 RepID=A0A387HSK4_9ACTN|nr:DUF1365 domain-containing protein [Streptomyces hundungensis]AYG85142.1 hypothetical protein DWB77_07359 [Streptomyces hundungensis]